jgi:ATP-dependent helicase HrpB
LFKTDLPVAQVLDELCDKLSRADELVLQAAPGAGKTTVVPLALLDAPWLGRQKIIVLEPRRMAARAAAQRMAELLGEPVGQTVGYRVRLEQKVSAQTVIEVITEGILTRMLQEDPALEGVGLLVFDEFHERSLDSDLGLALALQGRELFRGGAAPLKLLVMSATLDQLGVADLLGGAPVLSCEGRQYPVSVQQGAPLQTSDNIVQPLVDRLQALLADPESGSILVFLPGQGEIRRVLQRLPKREDVLCSPLYGGLSLAEQQLAINPCKQGRRKVVLATNIAETSLTIEGINTVLDSGLAREPVYDPGTGMTRLALRRISRSSSVQRAGRAGRLGPGQCYRLWSEQQQQQLAPHSTPEILQADLTPLALQLLAWGVEDPGELAWLDLPPAGPYAQALALLAEFGAAERTPGGSWRLLDRGRHMSRLPVHPRLAHMLLAGVAWGVGEQACRLAALLSERDPLAELGVDLNRRLAMVAGDAKCPGNQRGWLQRVRKQAGQYTRLCSGSGHGEDPDIPPGEVCGLLLACAYPDRLARRRTPGEGDYQLSNGRSAVLALNDELCGSEWLAVAELGGRVGQARDRIYLAAELTPAAFSDKLEELVRVRELAQWDDERERFVAERCEMVGKLVLSRKPLNQVSAELRRDAVAELLRRRGLDLLPWSEVDRQWQARVLLLREVEGERWPDVSDEQLLASLDEWLAPWLDRIGKLGDFRKLELGSILRALLPWPLSRDLDELAPERIRVPSGSTYRVDYTRSPPVLEVKLQEMFGSDGSPAIARGRVQLMLHLLSPAGRPLQVTRDLAGFWKNAYREVQKEMKGRYPKHPWPDDPVAALPTRHTKKRQARES